MLHFSRKYSFGLSWNILCWSKIEQSLIRISDDRKLFDSVFELSYQLSLTQTVWAYRLFRGLLLLHRLIVNSKIIILNFRRKAPVPECVWSINSGNWVKCVKWNNLTVLYYFENFLCSKYKQMLNVLILE